MADDVDEARLTRIESMLERLLSDVGRLVSFERYTIEQDHQNRAIADIVAVHDRDVGALRTEMDALRRDETNTRRWLIATFITLLALVVGVYAQK